MHVCHSGAQLDYNYLSPRCFSSHFRHDGGEHRRVFSQRGSRHCPQRRNQREHVRFIYFSSSSVIIPYNDDHNTFRVCNVAHLPVVFPSGAIVPQITVRLSFATQQFVSCHLQLIEEQFVGEINISLPLRWNQVSQMVALLPCFTPLQPGLREGRFCHIAPPHPPLAPPPLHTHGCMTE